MDGAKGGRRRLPLLVLLLHVVALSRLAVATTAMRSSSPRCRIFNFGDSNSDTGGLKAGVGFPMGPPHGYLFFGRSTGRWSDGRLYIDFLCQGLQMMSFLSPYMEALGSDFTIGANFAVAGARTQPKAVPFSLYIQVQQFQHFKNRTKELMDDLAYARYLIPEEGFEKAIYSIDIGQNDISTAFYSNFTHAQVIDSIPPVLSEIESAIQECLPSSSSGHIKSYFIGMGFSPKLVNKVLKKHGEEDADALLEILLTHSALDENSCLESSNLDNLHGLDGEEDELFTSESENEESGEHRDLDSGKRSSLLAMNFATEEVELAIKILGENAPLTELVDFIIASQTSQSSKEKDLNGSVDILGRCKESALDAMFGTMDATLRLLHMGFTEQEISSAIDNFGSKIPVCELADKILATRILQKLVKEEEGWSEDSSNNSCQSQNGRRCLDHSTEEYQSYFSAIKLEENATENSAEYVSIYDKTEGCSKRSFSATGMGQDMMSSLQDVYNCKEMQREKKSKCASEYDKSSVSCSIKEARIPKLEDEHLKMPGSFKEFSDFPAGSYGINKHEQCNPNLSVSQSMSRPPFFFYGNVVDVSQGTWKKLSHFLFGIEPEHVNTRFFSAFIRDEGYFHNLPKENRFHIIPKPPMTIEDALPRTRKWWASWDTRRQFGCLSLDTVGVPHICKRLEKMLTDCHGILSKEQQMDALHQCKTLNLVWVGENRLSPIEPNQIERILGYPEQHTQIQGMELSDRLRALKCSFQTDALGYHVSVLKQMFPSGLRVLSIFSGIGGAEVALHRLGIRLKCVISVEASEANRRILKRWWQNTGQSGELWQIEGIEKLTSKKVENLIEQFGGFDIVIGGSPCTCACRGPSSGRSVGLDLNVFYEYVRVLRTVRSAMCRNS